ncbi:MAG TPA: helicase, partial [Acidobacteriota bacterium]|nr:helicase [Acidobacteriota bacterium]
GELRRHFLNRFQNNVQADTQSRFLQETTTDLLFLRINEAVRDYESQLRDLENARKRLRDQLSKLDVEEKEAKDEIEQEINILNGRLAGLGRTSALEILTDTGLLPNYAFPERGVRFYGAVYNRYRQNSEEIKPVELTRSAGVALKELAPANHFYTHGRQFEIQQLAIGNPQHPLIEEWAICGACGHLRRAEELSRPDAIPACPQCGYANQAGSQLEVGQRRQFIEFSKSQALSTMEHYESLASDLSDEREQEFYQTVHSFDLTKEAPVGAVGDEELPFGIEYRASVTMRTINAGFHSDNGTIPFGVNQKVSDQGFKLCRDCGIAFLPGKKTVEDTHRRSCRARRRFEKLKQEGRLENTFQWHSVYLYRELKSEAIRLLLPFADDADV